jgi:ABC-type glycerol-3-phosphate transport system substrate-binding protein
MDARFKRSAVLVSAAAVAAVSLGACAGGSGGTDEGVDAAGKDAEASIIWYGWTPGPPMTDDYIAAFNQDYPNIKVEWKQIDIDGYNAAVKPAIASDSSPDVYEMSAGSANGGAEIFGGSAVDLTSDVEALLGADWRDKLSTVGVDAMTVKDRLVAMSVGMVYSGTLWINQDLFDEYSLTPPTTYDEWKSVCKTFQDAGQGCFVQGANQGAFNIDTLHAISEQFEPGWFDKALAGEAKWTDQTWIDTMAAWKSLFDDGIMQPGAAGLMQYPEANNSFLAGDYAMVMMGTWYTINTQTEVMIANMEAAGVANPEPFAMVPIMLPDMAGKGNTGILFGDPDYANGVSLKSKNQAAAKSFALWLSAEENGQQAVADSLNLLPILNGITPNWDKIELVNPEAQEQTVKELFDKASQATSPRFGKISADMNDALVAASQSVATGEATPEQSAKTLQDTADSL